MAYPSEVRRTVMLRNLIPLAIVGFAITSIIATGGTAAAFGGVDSPAGETAKHGSWHAASPSHHGDPGKKYSRNHKQDRFYRDRARRYWLAMRDNEQTQPRTGNR